ncbi:MAG: hypothetical protein EB102_12150 [Gammaproteobacteria bacterium]|nr:hypothetical protein [Gammaproteobacteria bacterium]
MRAKARLKELGIKNVRFRHGDGYEGWKAQGPYDGILVAAAPLTVPETLMQQLAIGGRLVMPVGGDKQELIRITRRDTGFEQERLGAVSFVPLQSGMIGAS